MAGGYLVDFKNVDLISLIQEQDADLGVDWRSYSEAPNAKKCAKTVDDEYDNIPKKGEAPQYEIDGETGEKLLQPTNRKPLQQLQQTQAAMPPAAPIIVPPSNVQSLPQQQNPQQRCSDGYLDDLNDLLKTSDDIQSQNFAYNAATANNQAINGDLPVNLVEPMGTDNGIPEYDEDIWRDIASLTDFSDMSFSPEPASETQQQQQPMMQQQTINANSFSNRMAPHPQQATFFGMPQQPMYNTSTMFGQYEPYGTQNMDCTPAMIESQQKHNYQQPRQNDSIPQPSSYQQQQPFASVNNQPYFGSYSTTATNQLPSSNLQQSVNFTNHSSEYQHPLAPPQQRQHMAAPQHHHVPTLPHHHLTPQRHPVVGLDASSSFPKPTASSVNNEPGGLFFDPHFNFTAGRSVEVAQHNSQKDHTPHLTTLTSKDYGKLSLDVMNRTGVKADSYESDSGVSMELSPQRFSFGARDSPSTPFLPAEVKKEPLSDITTMNAEFSRELKGVKHNHTYYGNGTKTRVTKKPTLNQSRESRDEKRARELGVPFTLDEIILTPVEEYNDMLARAQLTPEQQALIKDIRRRGKNKVAAQNCRKRKVETITNMEEDVDSLRLKKMELSEERNRLEIRANQVKHKYEALYKQVFETLRNDRGEPLDPSKYRLELVEGTLFILPDHQEGSNEGSSKDHSSMSIDFNKVKLEMID